MDVSGARWLAQNMQRRDVEECRHFKMSPSYAVFASLAASDWAATLGGYLSPVGIIGLGRIPGMPGVGQPWLLTSIRAPLYRAALYRAVKVLVDEMLEKYPILTNQASAANAPSLVLIKHLGFTLMEPEHGTVHFYKRRSQCAQ